MSLPILILVYFFSFAVARAAKPLNREPLGNSIYYLFLMGFVFYAGTSIANSEIPKLYAILYFIFLLTFCISYRIHYIALKPLQRVSSKSMEEFLTPILTNRASSIVIAAYLLVTIVPLLVPTFRLGLLVNPPQPDLTELFSVRLIGEQKNDTVRAALLLKTLATPIFYLAIYSMRRNLLKVCAILFLVFYIEYLDVAYKSRGELIVCTFPLAYYLWMCVPKYRKMMILIGVFCAPFFFQLFDFYELVRLGEGVTSLDISFINSIERLLLAESSFVEIAGLSIIYSDARADLWSYFVWMVTLPLPKLFTGDFSDIRINTELSMLALNLTPDQKGFFILLPGVIAESVYLFGRGYFWLHAIFMGFMVAFLTRVFQGGEKFVFLAGYIGIVLMYNFNRGGIASTLPIITNHLLVLYAVMLLFAIKKQKL